MSASIPAIAPAPGAAVVPAPPLPPGSLRRRGRDGRPLRRVEISLDEVARGASEEVLSRPAGELLAELPWEGPAPDPDVLDAMTYLAWL